MEPKRELRIGEVARAAGVKIDTLRYYERRGLLEEPARRPSGYRAYPPEAVDLVRFVRRAQALGFALEEIEDLLRLRQGRGGSRPKVRALAEAKLRQIDEKLADLAAMRGALAALVHSCGCKAGALECPILESLGQGLPARPAEVRHARHA
ncbi:MAG: MerR family transcriptional regulator [Deltaproteobacteria bacterium]